MKKIFALFLTLILTLCLFGCGNEENVSNEETLPTKYDVQIEIECSKNLLFSRYDVNILVDDEKIGTLDHGATDTYNVQLEQGEHTLNIRKYDDSTVNGSIKFIVNEASSFKYKISCSSDQVSIEETGQINMPIASNEIGTKTYEEIKSLLSSAGFKNIEGKALQDLTPDEIDKNQTIQAIHINNSTTFTKEDKFFADTEIVIDYHTLKKLSPPYNTDTAEGMNYLEVVEAFKKAGFSNIITEKRFEAEFWGYTENTVANIYINGSGVHTDWTYEPDCEVRIDYYVISDGDTKSDTELTQFYAQKAFEKYGEAIYPYGFKCHWILDLINAEQYNDGSWFFKVGVTIKNQYGTEYDTIAEGKVSGTDKSAKVVQFHVSQ